MIRWHITPPEAGLSALELLQKRLPGARPAYLRRLLRQGKVRRLKEPLDPETPLQEGDPLSLPSSRRLLELLPPADLPGVVLLLEDHRFLAVSKPAGLAVHRGAGHERDHLQARVLALLSRRGEPTVAAPVHRLDIPTSGPVLFAKDPVAAACLGNLFERGEVEKVYLALAVGKLPAEGRLNSPVRSKGRLRPAATPFRRLALGGGFSLVEIRPETGRTHQIRQHLAGVGHPLLGDRRYGGPSLEGSGRIFLHCLRLDLPDPWGDGRLRIEAPLPEDLRLLLAAVGMEGALFSPAGPAS